MDAMSVLYLNLWAKLVHAIVVAPDLTVIGFSKDLILPRRLLVDALSGFQSNGSRGEGLCLSHPPKE
jgi:hypothetical protein